MSSFTTCPSCNYTRQPTDVAPDCECPKCQKVYIKTASAIEEQGQQLMDRTQPASFGSSFQPAQALSGESLQEANKRNKFDPNNPEKYLREQFLFIDQWYRQFESLFDASVFGDPVAMQTKWTTAAFNATAEQYNRTLVEAAPGRIEFRATTGMKLFGLFFIFAGMTAAMANSLSHLPTGKMVAVLLTSAAFVIAGITLLLKSAVPIVFDMQRGFFWIGKKTPDDLLGNKVVNGVVRLQDIHALQLIFCSGVGNYAGTASRIRRDFRYEFNLVLHDGKRKNVIVASYYNRERLQSDAATVARFLGKPLWNAIDSTYGLFDKMQTQADYDQYFGEEK